MALEYTSQKMDTSIWDSGKKITIMEREFLSILMGKGTKDKWILDWERVKEPFILTMVESIEDHGREMRKMDTGLRKEFTIMRENGKMI